MARKKVKLAWITNDASRKATFKKRKRGLMKKVGELSTLCGVNACAIVYSPYDVQPETWPAPYAEAHRIMLRFKDLPEMEQSKKMINQEGFLLQRIQKMKEQLHRQQRDNREKEIAHLMYQTLAGKGLHDVCSDELSDLVWLIEGKMKAILDRMEGLRNEDPTVVVAVFPPPPPHQNGGTADAVLFNNINGQHQYQQSFGGEQQQQQLQQYQQQQLQQHQQQQLQQHQQQQLQQHQQQQQQQLQQQQQQEQQQHQQPEQQQNKTELQMAMEALQRQTWFMDQMETMNNPHEQMGNYFGDHSHHQEQNTQQVAAAAAPYNDHNNNGNPWSNSLFP